MEREALKLALEALEEYADHEGKTRAADEAITAIKEALAQPAQEPDALTIAYQSGYHDGKKAAQRPWVGITNEEIHCTAGYNETREMYQFALALIAKLRLNH